MPPLLSGGCSTVKTKGGPLLNFRIRGRVGGEIGPIDEMGAIKIMSSFWKSLVIKKIFTIVFTDGMAALENNMALLLLRNRSYW